MKLTKEWVEAELKRAEQQEPHRPPEEEYAFYMAVRDGNMEYVQKNCAAEVFSNPVGMGVLSKNPLQNIILLSRHPWSPGIVSPAAWKQNRPTA